MHPPEFKQGVVKGLVDHLAQAFDIFIIDIQTAKDAAAKKKAVAKFTTEVTTAREAFDTANDIIDE